MANCKFWEDKIIPWMKEKGAGKKFEFQQDSAPAHTAKKTVNLLEGLVCGSGIMDF